MRELMDYASWLPALARDAMRRRYRRTRLGWPWLVVRPLVAAIAGTVLFSTILGVQPEGVPYILFYLAGLSLWQLFDLALLWATRSLEINRRLLDTVYFPRLLLPVSHLFPAVIEFGVFLGVLGAMGAYHLLTPELGLSIELQGLALAAGGALYLLALALSFGLWTSVLGAKNRDLRFMLRYVTQIWMYATPVVYPMDLVPERWRTVIELNPATFAVQSFRAGLLGTEPATQLSAFSALLVLPMLMVAGLWFFQRAPVTSLERV